MSSPTAASLDIRRTATLARLQLTAEEEVSYSRQLARVLEHIAQLSEVNTDGIEPTAHPIEASDVTRADSARPGQSVDTVIGNAPRHSAQQILVPKVVE